MKKYRGLMLSCLYVFSVWGLGIAVVQDSFAGPVGSAQAEMAVRGWLKADQSPLRTVVGQQIKRVETFNDAEGAPLYYIVYLDPEGFVIVPADDLIEPIIGFASAGEFDPSPDTPLGALVSSDLSGRMQRVKGMATSKASGTDLAAKDKWAELESLDEAPSKLGISSVSDVRVSPLVETVWSQTTAGGDACYNYYTPPNAAGTSTNYPCGCVATAMAQLMRFWQYPVTGVGTASFSIEVDSVSENRSLRGGDGSGGAYEWSNMVLDPASSSTLAQRQAIGALCHDAGVTVNMSYESGGSATDTMKAKDAFTGTFGYDNAIKGYNSGSDIGLGLNGMVNPNLDSGGPVLLGITGTSGGHAIVCDGYGYNLSTLYHHLNLGWAGSYDAWYNLPTIEPGSYSFNSVYKCVYNVWTNGSGEIISGRVVDSGGTAITGAVVTAARSGGGIYSATTDVAGIYALAKIPASSSYTVAVSKVGYTFTNRTTSTGSSSDYSSTSGNKWAIDYVGEVASMAPSAPSSIWASATNSTDFTAAWSSVSNATSYRFDVSTNSDFSISAGGGGTVQLGESMDSGLAASYTTGDQTLTSGVWNTTAVYQEASGESYGGSGAAARLNDDTPGAFIRTPALNTAGSITFWYRELNSGGGDFVLQKSYDGSAWIGVATQSFSGNTFVQYSNNVDDSASTIYLRVLSDDQAGHLIVDEFEMTSYGSSTPDYVAGYSNRTVTGTSQSVTGLTASSTYYFRARAFSTNGTSSNSVVANVTTESAASGTPPTVDAISAQVAIVGVDFEYTVTATEADGDTVTFACTSTVDEATWLLDEDTGDFLFVPTSTELGANSFSFIATDPDGTSDPVVMSVVVSAAATTSTVSFGVTKVVGEEGGSTVILPVTLSAAADATVQVAVAGTALPGGTDFSLSTTVVFSVSGSVTSNLVLTVVDDDLSEGPESVRLNLIPVSGATLGTSTQAIFFIRDNDAFSILTANLTSGTNEVNDATTWEAPGERILEALQSDIVLMQEWVLKSGTTPRDFVDEIFGTNFYYSIESETGLYSMPNGIISRWPITASGEWADTEVGNRDFAWATINLPGPRDLHVVSVHLKASGDVPADDLVIRTDEARALTNYIASAGWPADDYLMLGGDLNLSSRTETTMQVLTNAVTDAHQPADQTGDHDTNSGRYRPYDLVLPNASLDARHTSFSCYGYTFANGIVFDTRITWSDGLPPPSLATDSDNQLSENTNMQHMAVLKLFEFESEIDPPQAFAATAASSVQIDLSFTTNSEGQDVVIVWNSDGNFSTPTGTVPSVGTSFAGGTVVYTGSASPQSHTGLSAYSTYYYSCWSVSGSLYSTGLTANATTDGLDAPASIWAGATNDTDFTAAWSAVSGATSYRLDVGTNATFTGGGGAGGTLIDEDFTDFSDWTDSGTANDTSHYGASSPCRALGTGDTLTSPAVNYPTQMTFYVDASSGGNGTTTTNYYSLDGGSTWNPIGSFTVGTAGATETQMLTSSPDLSGSTNVMFRFVSAFYTWYLDDVKVTGGGGSGPSYVPGYSNRTVSGTSQSVTGLTSESTYYFRARAVAAGGTSVNSATASVTTTATTITNQFEDWVTEQGEDPADPDFAWDADIDEDGATTWDEFLADTDPNLAGSVLVLTGSYTIATGGGTGDILLQFPASPNRYYQLEYCVGLTNHLVSVSNLGWGVPGMTITNSSTGTWYGVIRALLNEP